MNLRLSDLKRVTATKTRQYKDLLVLKEELKKKFPTIAMNVDIERLADNVYDLVEINRMRNVEVPRVKLTVLVKLMNHDKAKIRKLAANLLPESFLLKMKDDHDPTVRAAVAKRLPVNVVVEMLKRYEFDDLLQHVVQERAKADVQFAVELEDTYGARLADEQRSDVDEEEKKQDVTELSDFWYENAARQLVLDYGDSGVNAQKTVEHNWVRTAVSMYAKSHCCRHIVVDKQKLVDAVYAELKDIEDKQIAYDPIKESIRFMKERANLHKKIMPVLVESKDPVLRLIREDSSMVSYMKHFEEMFKVQHSTVPHSVKKYYLCEDTDFDLAVPMLAYLPEGKRVVDYVAEKAIDHYVDCWNRVNNTAFSLDWSQHPEREDKISFQIRLK
jgi:hypothetical protein